MSTYYQFKWRHWWRQLAQGVGRLVKNARAFGLRYIWDRRKRRQWVQRFVLGWLAAVGLAAGLQFQQLQSLDLYYLSQQPGNGGVHVEGVVGEFTSLNPLFVDNQPSRVATRLLFNGLTKRNERGEVVPELAAHWEVNRGGANYVLTLKDNLRWHDDQPLRAADVVFTIQLIQDPEVRSPLRESWQGVKVRTLDDKRIEFELPAPFAPFLQQLTVGILPQHLLAGVPKDSLRVSNFNQHPIGSGPYRFSRVIEDRQLQLEAFNGYVHGRPLINNLIVKKYNNYHELAVAFRAREVNGVGGFGQQDLTDFTRARGAEFKAWNSANQTFLFFNTQQPLLSNKQLRRALIAGLDHGRLLPEDSELLAAARSPLLPQHIGYDPKLTQQKHDQASAESWLDEAGWSLQEGRRRQHDQVLQLTLKAPDHDYYPELAQTIKQQLDMIGIEVLVQLINPEQLSAKILPTRDYDLLLYTLNLGADADSYAYWHSSQAISEGLNLASYKSDTVDQALEAGRTRLDPLVRTAKYHAFLEAWREDAPAMALFNQRYPYIYRGVNNLDLEWLADPGDRFYDVHKWAVKTEPQLRRLVE